MLRKDIIDAVVWTWGQIRGLRHSFVINCLVGFFRVFLSLYFVWLSKHIIDIATHKCEGDMYFWVTMMVALILTQLVVALLFTRFRERNRLYISNQLRRQLFQKVMNSRWDGKDALHSGDTVNRLESDISTVCDTVNEQIPALLVMAFQLVCASFFLFTMQKELLWVILVIMPVAMIVSKIYFRTLRKITADIRAKDSQIQSHLQENILKRVLIMSMIRLDECVVKLSEMQDSKFRLSVERVNYSSRARFFVSLGFMTGYCVTFCWGAFGIVSGTVTYGMMTAFLQLVNQVQNPIVNMSHSLPALIQTLTSIDRLKELNDLPQEDYHGQHHLSGSVGIRVEGLTYTYPTNQEATIRNLSYDFHPGVSTAVVGETGAGKSTLIRLLLNILQPDSGRVKLYTADGSYDMEPSLRCNFKYVPQGNSLMSGTVRENLLLGRSDATDAEMTEALRLAAADFVFQRPEGLDLKCSEQGAGLSEGQAQRIAIARALLQPGKVMLMDEACSALDVETERRILDNLARNRSDCTIIWITHHLAVKKFMDSCLEM